jgi:hypothetical protein
MMTEVRTEGSELSCLPLMITTDAVLQRQSGFVILGESSTEWKMRTVAKVSLPRGTPLDPWRRLCCCGRPLRDMSP